jgi:UDP-galactopyranose mutase
MFDFLVVGAGFAGSVLAERLASQANKTVLVVEKRTHIGGNAYDCYDDAGVLIHKYGPHIFHTNSAEVFDYLSRFTAWRPYQHRVLASVDGQLVPMPINLDTVNRLYGTRFTSFELQEFFRSVAEPRDPIRTSEDVVVSRIASCTRNSSAPTRASSGASIHPSWTPPSRRVCQSARTATIATSPTATR